jgi:hypothetical protein
MSATCSGRRPRTGRKAGGRNKATLEREVRAKHGLEAALNGGLMQVDVMLARMREIGAEQNSTIVFQMSIDIIRPFLDLFEKSGKAAGANGDDRVPLMMDVPLAA